MLLLAACNPEPKEIAFPGGLEPFSDALPACPQDPSAEDVAVSSTKGGDYFVATACGHVAAEHDAVVAAITTPEAGVDRRAVALEDIVVTEDTDPTYEVSYEVDTLVHDVVDVQYVLAWRHGTAGEGVWATRWQITTENPYVLLLEGSVVTTAEEGAVRLEMVEHIDALLDSEEKVIVQFLDDFHASVRALAHGEALPTWE